MPQPVKLSDDLINAAREAAQGGHRSLAAQIEHWATIGRSIEGKLTAEQAAALKRGFTGVREPRVAYVVERDPDDLASRIADAIERSLSPDFGASIRDELRSSPFPAYGTHPDFPGKLVRRDPDGTLTPGRMVNRQFIPDGSKG